MHMEFLHKRKIILVVDKCFVEGESRECLDHRWPKRNMSLWWRNMRVCMGKIEFETYMK